VVTDCPSCTLSADRILERTPLVLVLYDDYPVSPGHTLIVPLRHVESFFDTTPLIQSALDASPAAGEDAVRTMAMRTLAKGWLICLLLLGAPSGLAQEAPDALIRSVIGEVLAAYETDGGEPAPEPERVRRIIETHVLPIVDFDLMCRLVLARYWRTATEAQRRVFTGSFRELLVRTYTMPLAEYSGQRIEFLPYHPGADPERASVRIEIVPHEGEPIPVTYRLRRAPEDGWKVYDVTIDGVSMVVNYRTAFATEIARDGLERFLASLAERAAADWTAAE